MKLFWTVLSCIFCTGHISFAEPRLTYNSYGMPGLVDMPSRLIGEDPFDIPNNLMPYIAKVASGTLPHLNVFGNDYDTRDCTGERDYIHVCDLARGHVLSVQKLLSTHEGHVVNLGTGQAYSVLEMNAAYSQAVGRDLPYVIAPRRADDVPTCPGRRAQGQGGFGL